ncbi:MAG: glycosyltransferase [Calditrichaeota bacterium]|nr:glycosyltransferase [Calditrichota bacterium]MCB9366007.1 glycosyltransferase [Calditrichota bacterium]MCB9391867.1 glycosyltransferase [Calditrichota bacterium]
MISFKKNILKRKSLKVVVPTPLYGGSLPVALHAAEAFEQLGHSVTLLSFEEQHKLYELCGDSAHSKEAARHLQGTLAVLLADLTAETALKQDADLVWFTAQSPVTVPVLRKLRQAGIRTAFWFVESIQRFEYWKPLAAEFDCFFTIQQGDAQQEIERAGARRVEYLPCAANPQFHCERSLTDEERAMYGSRVSFVGAGYPNRVELFQKPEFRNIKIWGNDWPSSFRDGIARDSRRLASEETALVYCSTDINVNIHSASQGQLLHQGDFVNPRTFEIAACGAFQIVDQQQPLHQLFDLTSELVVVKSARELKDAIAHYAQLPEERMQYASKAQKRVLAEHTYVHRVEQALRAMGMESHPTTTAEASPTIGDLVTASWGDRELMDYFDAFESASPARLNELVAKIPAGKRELSRPELLLLLMNEFRQWGIEKGAIEQ